MRRLVMLMVALSPLPAIGAEAAPIAEWLELSGWPPQRLTSVADETPLTDATRDALLELAERFRRLPTWAFENEIITSTEQRHTPSAGDAIDLSGRLVSAARLPGSAHAKLSIRLSDDAGVATVFTLAAPDAWFDTPATELDEPIHLRGLVIDWQSARRLIIAPRVAWRPTSADGERVSLGAALLGQAAMDVGLLDDLADGKPLTANDAEPFYRSLVACRRYAPGQLLRVAGENLPSYAAAWRDRVAAGKPGKRLAIAVQRREAEGHYSVAPLFNDAARQRGQLVAFEGTVRRAVRIELSVNRNGKPSRVPQRYGVDHYYELELFPEDSQNLPLVFCVLGLPEGFPVGDAVQQRVRIAGFFLKRWAYRTRKTTDGGDDHHQLAPLLVSPGPVWLPGAGPQRDDRTAALVGVTFVGVLAIVTFALWRQAQADRRFERSTLARYKSAGGASSPPPIGD